MEKSFLKIIKPEVVIAQMKFGPSVAAVTWLVFLCFFFSLTFWVKFCNLFWFCIQQIHSK